MMNTNMSIKTVFQKDKMLKNYSQLAKTVTPPLTTWFN